MIGALLILAVLGPWVIRMFMQIGVAEFIGTGQIDDEMRRNEAISEIATSAGITLSLVSGAVAFALLTAAAIPERRDTLSRGLAVLFAVLLQVPGLFVTRFSDPRWRGEDEDAIHEATAAGIGWMTITLILTALVGAVAWYYCGGLTAGVIGALIAPLALVYALVGIFTLHPDRDVTSSIWIPPLLAVLFLGASAALAAARRWWGGQPVRVGAAR